MTLFQFLGQFMMIIWNFFRLPFPGTRISIGSILFLPMVVGVAIAFLRTLFGVGGFGTFSRERIAHRQASERGNRRKI